ncbi:hypothetical protein [Pseudomonas syringae group genomosp. 3]|uniref:hypothetical protein n=1 Tax=Pseudomonas syringae group genomosp. 3 TaxID=251701 RepID=UPI002D7E3033|nr:hypothetical protein [Pseudomonas syringae group genomosp. 3]
MISSREEVTKLIVATKVSKGIKWGQVAEAVGMSKEWTTAGCLGQMTFDKAQAEAIGKIFGLPDEAVAWLQIVPYKGSLPTYPIHEPHISSHWLTPDAVLPFSFRSQHHDATRRQSRESLPLSQTRGFQKIHRWLSCFGRVGY